MPRRVLVVGGSRYFGRRLVELLVARGDDVTVVTRGHAPVPCAAVVEHVRVDRRDADALGAALAGRRFDVVHDQVCTEARDAEVLLAALGDRVGRYVLTSSQAVYFRYGLCRERDFDPAAHRPRRPPRNYVEAKRGAEAIYAQATPAPVAAARLPIVLGPGDYTGRLEHHADRVARGEPLRVQDLEARASFISAAEAAEFLVWLGASELSGPFNACSDGTVSMGHLLAWIGEVLGATPRIIGRRDEGDLRLVRRKTKLLDTTRARDAGFAFSHLDAWLRDLVRAVSARRLLGLSRPAGDPSY